MKRPKYKLALILVGIVIVGGFILWRLASNAGTKKVTEYYDSDYSYVCSRPIKAKYKDVVSNTGGAYRGAYLPVDQAEANKYCHRSGEL